MPLTREPKGAHELKAAGYNKVHGPKVLKKPAVILKKPAVILKEVLKRPSSSVVANRAPEPVEEEKHEDEVQSAELESGPLQLQFYRL